MKGGIPKFGLSGSKKKGNFSKSMSDDRINRLLQKKRDDKKEKRKAQAARDPQMHQL